MDLSFITRKKIRKDGGSFLELLSFQVAFTKLNSGVKKTTDL